MVPALLMVFRKTMNLWAPCILQQKTLKSRVKHGSRWLTMITPLAELTKNMRTNRIALHRSFGLFLVYGAEWQTEWQKSRRTWKVRKQIAFLGNMNLPELLICVLQIWKEPGNLACVATADLQWRVVSQKKNLNQPEPLECNQELWPLQRGSVSCKERSSTRESWLESEPKWQINWQRRY